MGMKLLTLGILALVVGVGWRVGGSLSTDALGMAVGMCFGVMAGIPTALILLASQRREDGLDSRWREQERPGYHLEAKPVDTPAQITNNYITHNHVHLPAHHSRMVKIEERN